MTDGQVAEQMKHLFFLVLLSISVYPYSPGKWSPMDKYSFGTGKNGPKSETVTNKDGNIIYTAEYEYDENGKLIRENYKNGSGTDDGYTVYKYDKNRLVQEELHSSKGMEESKIFKYKDPSGELKTVSLLNAESKEIFRCKVIGMWNEWITEGEIYWLEAKETEIFSTSHDPGNPKQWNQEIYDEKKKSLAQIQVFFDEKGKIIRRENHQSSGKKMSELKYDENGRISEMIFSVYTENKWVPVKTHKFSY